MSEFTPVPALLGGALIGLAATLLLAALGRIAGVSGIVAGVLRPVPGEFTWRASFVAGLLAGGALLRAWLPGAFAVGEVSIGTALVAGTLVGFGTRLGSGCTSGHGVCGISRLSIRSLVATVVFMASGMATVYVARHVWGGTS